MDPSTYGELVLEFSLEQDYQRPVDACITMFHRYGCGRDAHSSPTNLPLPGLMAARSVKAIERRSRGSASLSGDARLQPELAERPVARVELPDEGGGEPELGHAAHEELVVLGEAEAALEELVVAVLEEPDLVLGRRGGL